MIVEFSVYDAPAYSVEHLFDSSENEELIASFSVANNAYGLESYLKKQAVKDEKENYARTYLVKDKATRELVCFFSLRTGLITIQSGDDQFDTTPAIELSNFATNSIYRRNHPEIRELGVHVFDVFILPIVRCMAKYVGVNSLYIYALPNDKLIEHYQIMGFTRLPADEEKFVQQHVKPKYDEGCIFMYQTV